MIGATEKLKRAARKYATLQLQANKTKAMEDRIKFIHAEVQLGLAAIALYEGESRDKHRRKTG